MDFQHIIYHDQDVDVYLSSLGIFYSFKDDFVAWGDAVGC